MAAQLKELATFSPPLRVVGEVHLQAFSLRRGPGATAQELLVKLAAAIAPAVRARFASRPRLLQHPLPAAQPARQKVLLHLLAPLLHQVRCGELAWPQTQQQQQSENASKCELPLATKLPIPCTHTTTAAEAAVAGSLRLWGTRLTHLLLAARSLHQLAPFLGQSSHRSRREHPRSQRRGEEPQEHCHPPEGSTGPL